jgi:hypothetical protein
MLPKFLLADNSQECLGRLFVVHAHAPRFILEGSEESFEEDQIIHWIDDGHKLNEEQIAELVRAAEEFLDAELDNQEALYDQLLTEEDEN